MRIGEEIVQRDPAARDAALAPARLDTRGLLALLERRDEVGVVSIFADLAPEARGTQIDIRNRLAELERRLAGERADALADALARCAPELDALFDPAARGRGRALFVPLSGGAPMRFATQMRFANRVVLDERPFIHPLLECLERGRPAGVVLLSATEAEVLEWRLAELLLLGRVAIEPDEPRERPGPVAGRQQSTPLDEHRRRRERDQRRRLIDQAAAKVNELARERGWERLVVSGGEVMTRPFLNALPPSLQAKTLEDGRHLIALDSNALARAVHDLLDSHQAEHELALVKSIRDAALAGRGGALGLSEVAAALNDARVEHLVYDPSVRHAGAIAADGLLVVPPERHPLGAPQTPEPRLTERLVERSLATGARVTPVSGPAAALLADMDGVAARLRW